MATPALPLNGFRVLDLTAHRAGPTAARQLADWGADVVLENYRSDVKHRLGVDYEAVRGINPRIVYGSISGFGQDGPYAGRPGVDQIAQGMGGLFTRWFHDRALFVGWLAGTLVGTAMVVSVGFKPIYPLTIGGFGFPCYIALAALVLNFAVVIVLTPVFDMIHAGRGRDDTEAAHTV